MAVTKVQPSSRRTARRRGAGGGEEEQQLNIAPKKPDWDLKRDVEKRLAKLKRRTQRAVVELIRKRIAEEREQEEAGGEEAEPEA
eukprot:g1612.t1